MTCPSPVQRSGLPALLLALVLSATGCSRETPAAATPPPPEVDTVLVAARPFAHTTELPGRIAPVRSADVRARVAGIVLKRHFTEGADIRAGATLFTIDPAPYKVALARAEAQLAHTEAALFEARTVAQRYAALMQIKAVSQQDYDAMQAAFKRAEAARASALADVAAARLNLDYTVVKAPVAGRIGRALVTEGALVGQDEATAMATIQQLDPIYADFTQAAADLIRLREAAGHTAAGRVTLALDGSDRRLEGRLLFAGAAVDPGTGQVSLRAEFPNPEGLLLPGMFVRVRTEQGVDTRAIFVPQQAVQRGSDGGAQVLIVDQDHIVRVRPVRTGVMSGDEWQIVSGLSEGEQVIVAAAAGVQPELPVTPRPALALVRQ
jgi:multidrug efflux system membrane fusion protein